MKAPIIAATVVTLLALAAEARQSQAPPNAQSAAPIKITERSPLAQTAKGPWRASDLINTPVYDMTGQQIGDVNDFMLDESGRPVSVVVATGGFLGIGSKEVVLPLDHAKRVMHTDGKSYFTLDASWTAARAGQPSGL
jgi:sporulation protein YlmC with PRC-barrel domain